MSNEEREIRDYEDLNAHTALSLNKAQHRIEQLEAKLARSDRKEIEAVYRKLSELEATIKRLKLENKVLRGEETFGEWIEHTKALEQKDE